MNGHICSTPVILMNHRWILWNIKNLRAVPFHSPRQNGAGAVGFLGQSGSIPVQFQQQYIIRGNTQVLKNWGHLTADLVGKFMKNGPI